MFGFATQTQDIAIGADTPKPVWELKLLPLDEITRGSSSCRGGEHASSGPARLAGGKTTASRSAARSQAKRFRACRREFRDATPPAPAPRRPATRTRPRMRLPAILTKAPRPAFSSTAA